VRGDARTGVVWSRGDVVALRDIWFGTVWRAIAGIMIEDDGVTSVFWIPTGSSASYPADAGGREIRIPQREFRRAMRRTPWACVVSCDSREPWTLWHFQSSEGRFDRWYVNFEHYLGRTTIAYDSRDHKLDLMARPDGSLEWKDEDELQAADRLGLVDAKAVRAEAQQVLAKPPWPTGWESFRPDWDWTVADLPEGWDRS
jgi:Protein of unknown function (DUF402)